MTTILPHNTFWSSLDVFKCFKDQITKIEDPTSLNLLSKDRCNFINCFVMHWKISLWSTIIEKKFGDKSLISWSFLFNLKVLKAIRELNIVETM